MTSLESVYRPARTLALDTAVSHEAWEQEYYVGTTVVAGGPDSMGYWLALLINDPDADEGWRLSGRAVKLRWAVEEQARHQLQIELPDETPDFEHVWDAEPHAGVGMLKTWARVRARYDLIEPTPSA